MVHLPYICVWLVFEWLLLLADTDLPCAQTLSVSQYETAVDSDSLDTLQPVAYHTVNRRYSEFLNLQTRLEENPELKKIVKSKRTYTAWIDHWTAICIDWYCPSWIPLKKPSLLYPLFCLPLSGLPTLLLKRHRFISQCLIYYFLTTCLLYISDVKGPKRLFPDLSFGNTDLEKADARKGQLDTFLKVSGEIEIVNSFYKMICVVL